jgi:hypothetical protein
MTRTIASIMFTNRETIEDADYAAHCSAMDNLTIDMLDELIAQVRDDRTHDEVSVSRIGKLLAAARSEVMAQIEAADAVLHPADEEPIL